MTTFQYLGNTSNSLAFRANNTELQQIQDFGVFDIPAEYDEQGNEIAPAKPYFTDIFGQFVDAQGRFLPDVTGFDAACEDYLNVIGWQWTQPEPETETE
jgi:hypothetical protein